MGNEIGEAAPGCASESRTRAVEAECYVEFRPKSDWTGEYGFDWMRISDYPLSGANGLNPNFNRIVGSYYVTPPGAAVRTVNPDGNSHSGDFVQRSDLLYRLERDYRKRLVRFNNGDIKFAFSSYLSMYINEGVPDLALPRVVTIKAVVKELRTPPDRFQFFYNHELFTIGNIPVAAGEHNLTIQCNEQFSTQQIVEVKAIKAGKPDKIVGLLIIVPNSRSKIKVIDVLMVRVKTPGINGRRPASGSISGQYNQLAKILRQAVINPHCTTISLDLSTVPKTIASGGDTSSQPQRVVNQHFIDSFIQGDLIMAYRNNDATLPRLKDYLMSKIQETYGTQYDNHYIAFYLGERTARINAEGEFAELNGYSSGNTVVMSPVALKSTPPHEFLHSLNLPHTFAGDNSFCRCTYKWRETDNIMDYTSQRPGFRNARISTFHWQWKIANENL